jgi:hypothetical protein
MCFLHTSKSVRHTHYIAVVLQFRNYLKNIYKFLTSRPTVKAHWFVACNKLIVYLNMELYLAHFCINYETSYCMKIVGCLWEPEYPRITYLLTPWIRVLLEKLTGSAASQEIPRIFRTRRFITVLTSVRHLSLS